MLKLLKEKMADQGVFYLSGTLLLFLFLPPFIRNEYLRSTIILALTTFLIASSLVVIYGHEKLKPWHFILIFILLTPWLLEQRPILDAAFYVIYFGLFGWTSYKITKELFSIEEVDKQVIVGSIVGYLMIGLAYTFLCALISEFHPEAFNMPESFYRSNYNFIYYTFVTMSTLGYGDVTPVSPQAQSLALIIAVTGQFYMVIVVAAIVGKYINKS